MDETFDLLGDTEKHVAGQLRTAIEKSKCEAQQLVALLDEIDLGLIDIAIIDADRKKGVLALVDPMQGLAANLGRSSLVPILAKALLEAKPTGGAS